MEKLIAALNKKGIFHTIKVTASGKVYAEVLKQPAAIDQEGKNLLKKFYGLTDFTVPASKVSPFEHDHEAMIKDFIKRAKQGKSSTTEKQADEGY